MADYGNDYPVDDNMFATVEAERLPTESSGGKSAGAQNTGGPQAIRREMKGQAAGWGRGPVPVDVRKYRYDVLRGRGSTPLNFSASKADRMSARDAGDMLESIHSMFGIDRQNEARLLAFDKALFFEHAINGASLLQPGRGELIVDGVSFDITPLKEKLGVDQRRFFRAFADDIAEVNKEILAAYDYYDAVSVEKVGFIRQLAAVRGLQKYPHLIHDSSDAGSHLTYDEHAAVANSKRVVLESTVNQADSWLAPRTSGARAVEAPPSRMGGS